MKLTVNTKQFKKAVKNCITEKARGGASILKQLYLKAVDGILIVYGTDLEMSTQFSLPANIQEEGVVLVDYKKLTDTLKTIKDKEITIKIQDDYLFINKTKISMNLKPDDFPLPDAFPSDLAISISGKELLRGINKTIYAISKEKTSHERFKGICFSFVDNNLNFVATNEHRLALYSTEITNKITGKYIIPEKVFKTLINLKPDGDVLFAVKDYKAFFKFDNVLIQVKLIDDVFPNYQSVIPDSFNIELKLDRYIFMNLLEEFITVLNHPEKPVILTISNNKLIITNNTDDVAIERIYDLDTNFNDFKISFNAKYLHEAISVIDDMNILVKFVNKDTQAVIIPETPEEKYLAVVMPRELNK